MNINFFEWLRDGVRRSVLLGVGDAMDQLGTPAEADGTHPSVAALFQAEQPKGKRLKSSGGRKRLGKTLKDLDPMPKE